MTRIRVDFQEQKHKKELATFQSKVDALNEVIALSKEITDGEISTYKLDEVNNWLISKTAFKSPLYSAKLMDVKTQYERFLTLNKTIIDVTDESVSEMFLNTPNGYILAPSFTAKLEDSNTIYLDDKLVKVYHKLNEIAKLLNDVENTKKTSSNYLSRDYAGIWSVALKQFHQININF